jgi:hypothetical protein
MAQHLLAGWGAKPAHYAHKLAHITKQSKSSSLHLLQLTYG